MLRHKQQSPTTTPPWPRRRRQQQQRILIVVRISCTYSDGFKSTSSRTLRSLRCFVLTSVPSPLTKTSCTLSHRAPRLHLPSPPPLPPHQPPNPRPTISNSSLVSQSQPSIKQRRMAWNSTLCTCHSLVVQYVFANTHGHAWLLTPSIPLDRAILIESIHAYGYLKRLNSRVLHIWHKRRPSSLLELHVRLSLSLSLLSLCVRRSHFVNELIDGSFYRCQEACDILVFGNRKGVTICQGCTGSYAASH